MRRCPRGVERPARDAAVVTPAVTPSEALVGLGQEMFHADAGGAGDPVVGGESAGGDDRQIGA